MWKRTASNASLIIRGHGLEAVVHLFEYHRTHRQHLVQAAGTLDVSRKTLAPSL
jgi:hypothetical protein